eukprot:Gb_10593 [translate_table: standard]
MPSTCLSSEVHLFGRAFTSISLFNFKVDSCCSTVVALFADSICRRVLATLLAILSSDKFVSLHPSVPSFLADLLVYWTIVFVSASPPTVPPPSNFHSLGLVDHWPTTGM